MTNINRSSDKKADKSLRDFVSPLIILLLLLAALAIYGLGQFGTFDSFAVFSLASPQAKTAGSNQNTDLNDQISDPVSTVAIFWEKSKSGETDQIESLVSGPGKGYSNDSRRCENSRADEESGPGFAATAILKLDKKGWQFRSIVEFRDYLAKNQFPERNIKLLSNYKDEAIVSVEYIDKNLPGIATVFQYFFLVRNDDKWTIFMVTNDPLFHNPSYAGQNCPREQ